MVNEKLCKNKGVGGGIKREFKSATMVKFRNLPCGAHKKSPVNRSDNLTPKTFMYFNGQDCLDNNKRSYMANVYLLIIRLLLMQIKSVNAFKFVRVPACINKFENVHFTLPTFSQTNTHIRPNVWICLNSCNCENVEHFRDEN